jgi:hypothetical protein
MSYQNEFKGPCGMQKKKKFSQWSQIPLKYLIDSVRCHVCANKRTTHATLKNYKKIQKKKLF